MKQTTSADNRPPFPQPANKLIAELEVGFTGIDHFWIDGIYIIGMTL